MDLYSGAEELSLFGGEQLLTGLGSPLEPDLPCLFPDGREITTNLGQLVKEQPVYKQQELVTSAVVIPLNSNPLDQASCLDLSWLDTKLDLYDLLGDSSPNDSLSSASLVNPDTSYIEDSSFNTSLEEPFNTSLEEQTAEALFNQISAGLSSPSPNLASPTNDHVLLSEVFNKLSSDIEQMVREDAIDSIDLPELGGSVLSPVSVDDIESLLSGPVSPLCTSSPVDSGLESVASTRPSSPYYSATNNDDDGDYQPAKKSKSRKRTTPYGKNLPMDRKERKKVQNKNAAQKYRQKKKGETETVDEQLVSLETKNKSLKDKVESMSREIQYLKDLMAEVVQAKGIKLAK